MDHDERQYDQYLNILSIFHYVVGAILGLFSCFPIIHLVTGLSMLSSGLFSRPHYGPGMPFVPVTFVGLFFTVIAGAIILFGWLLAIAIFVNGIFLRQRQNYTFCLIVAGIESLFVPFGTILGVLTLITLLQPTAKRMFPEATERP